MTSKLYRHRRVCASSQVSTSNGSYHASHFCDSTIVIGHVSETLVQDSKYIVRHVVALNVTLRLLPARYSSGKGGPGRNCTTTQCTVSGVIFNLGERLVNSITTMCLLENQTALILREIHQYSKEVDGSKCEPLRIILILT